LVQDDQLLLCPMNKQRPITLEYRSYNDINVELNKNQRTDF
jgi:hypothetical protein